MSPIRKECRMANFVVQFELIAAVKLEKIQNHFRFNGKVTVTCRQTATTSKNRHQFHISLICNLVEIFRTKIRSVDLLIKTI